MIFYNYFNNFSTCKLVSPVELRWHLMQDFLSGLSHPPCPYRAQKNTGEVSAVHNPEGMLPH